jgi:hypothetical protein
MIKRIFFFLLSFAIFFLVLKESGNAEKQNQPETRKITPPKLTPKHLGKKIRCHRPMRRGTPKMNVEVMKGKVIANNYGHGGSGWTLAPGSAKYVIELLEADHSQDLKKDASITIIGAGVLGLFSAYTLVNKGYTNISIVAEKFENLTSHHAGGLLAPVSMDNDPDLQKIIDKIGIEAYRFYDAIANKKNPILKEGAIIVPTYFREREDSGLEPYVGKVMKPAKDVVLDFGNGTTQKMVAYDDGIFMDTGMLMKDLTKYLRPRVTFIQKKINDFSEIDSQYIINCSGLGSEKLNSDRDVVPVQGHLIMLKDENPQDLQYMILIYYDEAKTKSGQKVKRSFYIFPKKLPGSPEKDIGVIGGTFIEGATAETPNEEEFCILVKGAKRFYGIQ